MGGVGGGIGGSWGRVIVLPAIAVRPPNSHPCQDGAPFLLSTESPTLDGVEGVKKYYFVGRESSTLVRQQS